jgi:hypothetical protein
MTDKIRTCESGKIAEKGRWKKYPAAEDKDFGHGKFVYFICCQDSRLAVRDYKRAKRIEPDYENRSYNEHAFCNQNNIRKSKKRGISYFVFITKYRGNYYITGWFPISYWREIQKPKTKSGRTIFPTRIAFKSDKPIFLSVEDSIKVTNEKWNKWFGKNAPNNLRHMAKFVEKNSEALEELKDYFQRKEKENRNKIEEYAKEITGANLVSLEKT